MRTGYRLAIAVAGITIVLAIVLAVAEGLGATRDANAYGEVPVPGRESVNLPAGEVIIFYGERIGHSEHPQLTVPRNLRLRVRTTNGQSLLGSTPYAFDQFDDGDVVRRAIAKLRVPEAGNYEAVASSGGPGAIESVISFGRNGTRDFGYVFFVLSGGLLLAAILAAITRLQGRMERHRRAGRA
jgi:hypothetical protein